MITIDEFITAVILRTKWVEGQRWRDVEETTAMKEMRPFFAASAPRHNELIAARLRLLSIDFYEQATQRKLNRHKLYPLSVHTNAVSAAVRWPEETSMLLSLPLDAVHVLLDAGNHCVLMIYPMMRLIHDDPRGIR